ncbi:MAG: YjbQ family protein [Candidatus Levybacteria bacterium]|nr:YjbQ family protein [Candidatus Levybacteria bacterium]
MELLINSVTKDQVIDITQKVSKLISEKNFKKGICSIFVKHTTCAVTTADLDPGTDKDLINFLRKISPNISYNHPHDPTHTPDHLLSSVIGTSVAIPVENRELELGTWQRIILVELNGPKQRKIKISFLEET